MTPNTLPDAPPIHTDSDGVIRVGATRVVLDVIVEHYQDGASAEEIAEMYDVLRVEDVRGAIAYYLQRRPQVDEYIARREREAEEARRRIEASRPSFVSEVLRRSQKPS